MESMLVVLRDALNDAIERGDTELNLQISMRGMTVGIHSDTVMVHGVLNGVHKPKDGPITIQGRTA